VGECWVVIFFVMEVEVDLLTVEVKVEVVQLGNDKVEVDRQQVEGQG
jgi:hypothetical protein